MLRGGSREDSTKSAKEWIHFFDLDDYANKPLETLSKGNQQKIQIAQAFVNDPDILILDEPFSGLDPVNARIFKNAIADFVERGKLVIFSSHQMSYVEEVCDDICLINDGNVLLTGSLEQIKRERGRGKLIFKAESVNLSETSDAIKQAFPNATIEASDGDFLIIDTNSQYGQEEILRFIIGKGWNIVRFGMFEPSLNDIFISLVGGEEE